MTEEPTIVARPQARRPVATPGGRLAGAVTQGVTAAGLVVAGWLALYSMLVGSNPTTEYHQAATIFPSLRTPVNVTVLICSALTLTCGVAALLLPATWWATGRAIAITSGTASAIAIVAVSIYYSILANRPEPVSDMGTGYLAMWVAVLLTEVACLAVIITAFCARVIKRRRTATAIGVVVAVVACAVLLPVWHGRSAPGLGPVQELDMHPVSTSLPAAVSLTDTPVKTPIIKDDTGKRRVSATGPGFFAVSDGTIEFYNGDTLTPRWKRTATRGFGYISAVSMKDAGVIVAGGANRWFGIDANSGETLWTVSGPRPDPGASGVDDYFLDLRDSGSMSALPTGLLGLDPGRRWLSFYSAATGKVLWTRDLGDDCAARPRQSLSDAASTTAIRLQLDCVGMRSVWQTFSLSTGTPLTGRTRERDDDYHIYPAMVAGRFHIERTNNERGPSRLVDNRSNRVVRTLPPEAEIPSCDESGTECVVETPTNTGLVIWLDGQHPDMPFHGSANLGAIWLANQILPEGAEGPAIDRRTGQTTQLRGNSGRALVIQAGLLTFSQSNSDQPATVSLYRRVPS